MCLTVRIFHGLLSGSVYFRPCFSSSLLLPPQYHLCVTIPGELAQQVVGVFLEMIPKLEWLALTSLYRKLTAKRVIMSHYTEIRCISNSTSPYPDPKNRISHINAKREGERRGRKWSRPVVIEITSYCNFMDS